MASKQTYINSKMETIERLSLTVLLLSERIQRRRKMFFSSSLFWFCWHDVCPCIDAECVLQVKSTGYCVYIELNYKLLCSVFCFMLCSSTKYLIFRHLLKRTGSMSTTAGRVMALPRPLRGSMKIWYQSSTVGAAASSFKYHKVKVSNYGQQADTAWRGMRTVFCEFEQKIGNNCVGLARSILRQISSNSISAATGRSYVILSVHAISGTLWLLTWWVLVSRGLHGGATRPIDIM